MTVLASLTTARDNIAAEIATISANPRTNYTVDGRTFDHEGHFANLMARYTELNQAVILAGGPGSQPTENILLG
ncbi:hypothetical protein LCGC14_2652160 [marine sediment metagenome]|uniref:Uncharacterized protein n=1 Tax=marine sediment metagenome TaxID=412755 RepID=A0A0F9C4V3_9ZZZZ